MSKECCKNLSQIYDDCLDQSSSKTPNEIRENLGYQLDLYWRKNRATLGCVCDIDNTFSSREVLQIPSINTPGPIILNKQQPSLNEAIKETTSRINFMENMVKNQPNLIQGIIMGGSLSYGRFVNVRGNYPNSSDLDLIIIMNNIPSKRQIKNILPTSIGFTDTDQKLLSERIQYFKKLNQQGLAQMISHKFCLPQNGFDVSIHFMDENIFSNLCHPTETDLEPSYLLDYKAKKFLYQVMRQKNISGEDVLFQISEQPTIKGVITKLPVYSYHNNFVPGIYHNLISPVFELFYGSKTVQDSINDFRIFMANFSKANNPNSPDITLSHPRKPLFSSYIISEVNEKI